MTNLSHSSARMSQSLLAALVIVMLAAFAYVFLTKPDQRTGAQKVGDAVSELPDTKKALRQLEDRTPGQKLGDAVEDTGEDLGNTIRENTQPPTSDH